MYILVSFDMFWYSSGFFDTKQICRKTIFIKRIYKNAQEIVQDKSVETYL